MKQKTKDVGYVAALIVVLTVVAIVVTSLNVPMVRAPGINSPATAMASVVKLSDSDGPGHGSGVVVDASGLILTNAHVCDETDEFVVTTASGQTAYGFPLWTGTSKNDVCLVKISGPGDDTMSVFTALVWTPITFAKTGATMGDTVYALGNPGPLEFILTKGTVGTTTPTASDENEAPRIMHTADIIGGSSGGPLVNEKGELVGLVVSGFMRNGIPLGFNFAIPLSLINEMLVR